MVVHIQDKILPHHREADQSDIAIRFFHIPSLISKSKKFFAWLQQ
jgi:hypothetical protein